MIFTSIVQSITIKSDLENRVNYLYFICIVQKSQTDHWRFEKYWTETFRYHWIFGVKSGKDKEMEKNKLNYSLFLLRLQFIDVIRKSFRDKKIEKMEDKLI